MVIGFIGIGTMGTPIVLNLLRKGFHVNVYARRPTENLNKVINNGAFFQKSLQEIGASSDVIMTCLPRPESSEEVILGETGVLRFMKRGSIIIELSTVPPSLVKRFGQTAGLYGVNMLDAPISGGRKRAEEGTLTIMVGGEKEVFEKCLPIFRAIGQKIYYVGELGNGEKIKLINSLIANTNLLVALEGLKLAKNSSVDLKTVFDIIENSTGQSWMWSNWIRAILNQEYLGVKLDIMIKDLSLALSMAKELGIETEFCKLAIKIVEEKIRKVSGMADASILYQE
jgi:3-hydroxyisobutyrate dehydrogenase-like beta-hydroxyacid dehydrogenase